MTPLIDREKTGKQIRRIIELRGLSVQDVQEFLSLGCVQSVYHWFDGKSMPTLDNLYALSELLRVRWICWSLETGVIIRSRRTAHARAGFFLTTGTYRNT